MKSYTRNLFLKRLLHKQIDYNILLTTESDSCVKVIFVKFSLAVLGERLNGERRVSGEGAQTGEKVGGQVRASRLGLLRPWKTNGGTQNRTCRI